PPLDRHRGPRSLPIGPLPPRLDRRAHLHREPAQQGNGPGRGAAAPGALSSGPKRIAGRTDPGAATLIYRRQIGMAEGDRSSGSRPLRRPCPLRPGDDRRPAPPRLATSVHFLPPGRSWRIGGVAREVVALPRT